MDHSRQVILEAVSEQRHGVNVSLFSRKVKLPFTVGEKCPYAFRQEETLGHIVDVLTKGRAYLSCDGCPVAWKVKAYAYRTTGDDRRDTRLDKAWDDYLTHAGSWIYSAAVEEAQRQICEEWSSYGDDVAEDFEFEFRGRSGGHLCLVTWRGINLGRMSDDDYFSFVAGLVVDWLESNGASNRLTSFYAAMVTADADFNGKNADENITAEFDFRREEWETERVRIADHITNEFRNTLLNTLKAHGYEIGNANEFAGAIERAAKECETILKRRRVTLTGKE